MSKADGIIKMSPSAWTASSNPVNAGSSDSNDLTNDITQTVNSLLGGLNTIGFLNSSKNLATALEDFGQGMAGALACVSTDLMVVGSGLAAAATAFAATDKALANMFAQLDAQLGYYTTTTTSTILPSATASAEAALGSLTVSGSSSSDSGNWFHFSMPHIDMPPTATVATAGAGMVGVLLIIGVLVLA